jgi:hypothetical protein
MSERAVPMIGDLELDVVEWMRQLTRQRTLSVPVAGLAGDVQQRLGRASHEIEIAGVLLGEGVADRLGELQDKAGTGEEVTFTADITTALELDKVVVLAAAFEEEAGRPGRYRYRLHLRESPPLPEPASLDGFGGLGDLGFDTDLLGDIADAAGALQDAIEAVGDALGALEALSALGDLGLGNPVAPMQEAASSLASVAGGGVEAAGALGRLMGGG